MLFNGDYKKHRERMKEIVNGELAAMAQDIETTRQYPAKAHELFAREGLLTLALPKEYGGGGGDATILAITIESIASKAPSAALIVFPTNAVLRVLAQTASQEQKDRFFKELMVGNKAMAFCLTEPEYGSEAHNLQTTARARDGFYRVKGAKSFITLGPNAHYYLAFVRTGPGPKAAGVSALMIPRSAEGVHFGPPERKMGLHGSITSTVYFDDVRVPIENRIGPEGGGFGVLARAANSMRAWGAGAMALGTAQGIFDLALQYAGQNGKNIRGLTPDQASDFVFANMKMKIEACRSLVYRTCSMVDQGNHPDEELETFSSLTKCFATDTGMEVADMAAEVIAPLFRNPDSLAACFFCAAKAIQIFDGTNQIQRMIVARNLAQNTKRP